MATITSPRASSPAIRSPSWAPTVPAAASSTTATDTPNSSARGSFEILPPTTSSHNPSTSSTLNPNRTPHGNTNNVGPAPATAQRRGNRAALRDYYNLKSKPQQTPQPGCGARPNLSRTASITSTTSENSTTTSISTLTEPANTPATSTMTAQLDAQDFDAQAYIAHLLSTSSLRDILKVEATLVSEIRNLDGERKALVYDNYSRLIKAVGTIGQMQRSMNAKSGGLSEVSELEGRMKKLGDLANSLGSPGLSDANTREHRRKSREEAIQQRKKSDLVKRVLAAPTTLRSLLDEDKDEEAEAEWTIVRKCLDAWTGVKGAAEIKAQCEAIMNASSDEEDGEESKDGS